MSDIAVANVSAPVAAPANPGGTPNTAPAESSAGWPTERLFGDDTSQQVADVQTGEAEAPNPDEPWQPDEALASRKTKLKVDGREFAVSVGDLPKLAQKGIAAEQRMSEAARIRREAEDSHTMLAESMRNPETFLQRLVEADEQKAIAWIDKLAGLAAQRLQMTPEQRELDRYQRTEQYRQQQAEEAQRAQATQSMQRAWGKTLELAQLPPGPVGEAIAAEMRERVMIARREGRNETPSSLAAFAKARRQQMEETFTRTLTPEQRQQMVRPEDLQKRARESASKPMIQATPARVPGGNPSGGQFKPGPRIYDPFGG